MASCTLRPVLAASSRFQLGPMGGGATTKSLFVAATRMSRRAVRTPGPCLLCRGGGFYRQSSTKTTPPPIGPPSAARRPDSSTASSPAKETPSAPGQAASATASVEASQAVSSPANASPSSTTTSSPSSAAPFPPSFDLPIEIPRHLRPTSAPSPPPREPPQPTEATPPGLPPPAAASAPPPSPLLAALTPHVSAASTLLNQLTGYSAVDALKAGVADLESSLASASARVAAQRRSYQRLVAERATTLREVNALLARKDGWTAADLERFTALYRADHGLESAVAAGSAALAAEEAAQERLRGGLNVAMLTRYHEEQAWSDKIRRLGSWTAVGLFALNLALWAGNLFAVEPWRRRRLVDAFEDKVEVVLGRWEDDRAATASKELEGGAAAPAEVEVVDAAAAQATASVASEAVDARSLNAALLDSARWKTELNRDRVVALTVGSVSTLVLEGAAAGAVAGAAFVSAVWLLRRT